VRRGGMAADGCLAGIFFFFFMIWWGGVLSVLASHPNSLADWGLQTSLTAARGRRGAGAQRKNPPISWADCVGRRPAVSPPPGRGPRAQHAPRSEPGGPSRRRSAQGRGGGGQPGRAARGRQGQLATSPRRGGAAMAGARRAAAAGGRRRAEGARGRGRAPLPAAVPAA
jgi:hypothetical protein